jgi:hypothetical protein
MGGNRRDSQEEQRRRLRAEAQQARARMLVSLSQDYAAAARRLGGAYVDVVAELNRLINTALILDMPVGMSAGELQNYLTPLEAQLRVVESALSSASADLSGSGVTSGVRAGVRNLQAGGVAVEFGSVNPRAITSTIDLVDSPAWREMVGRYAPYHTEQVGNLIITAQSAGKNPREVAQLIATYFDGQQKPLDDALRIARQSQIYSARVGISEVYREAGIGEWMWSANLGSPRTCLACITMHGTVHPSTEVLNDHFRGRCGAVPMTPSWRSLGYSTGRDIEVELGKNWLLNQSEDDQRRYMGRELYEAWRMGRVREIDARTVVGIYEHPVWGGMRVRKSNAEILRR